MEKENLIGLVTGAQAGAPQALDGLFRAYYNDVYYFALKTVKDADLACDITQETFLEIIRTIGNLKEPAAFVTWMKQITYHQCTRYFQKKKEVLVEEDEDGNTIFDTLADESEGSIPSEVLEQEEFRQTILQMIDRLTEEQRSAVMLYYFDELSVGQIAAIQGVTDGTVKSRLNYARKAIKKSVESYEEKHGIKLHSFAILPLLMLFFGKESMPAAKAAGVRATVMASAKGAAVAAAGTATAGAAASAASAPAATGLWTSILPLFIKILSLILGLGIVIAGIALVVKHTEKPKDQPEAETQQETDEEETEEETEASFPETEPEETMESTTDFTTDETTPAPPLKLDFVIRHNSIALSHSNVIAVREDGTALHIWARSGKAYFDNQKEADYAPVSTWTDLVSVAAGKFHVAGLKSDGTVVAAGENDSGQCDVQDWTDIVAISVGGDYTAGLKSDGTLVYAGDTYEKNLEGTKNFRDIVAISSGGEGLLMTLHSDGVARYWANSCVEFDWRNVVQVSSHAIIRAALIEDGTVQLYAPSEAASYTTDWCDIVQIATGDSHVVGLKADGTLVAAGKHFTGELSVYHWTDVVAVYAGGHRTIGLKADGTVLVAGQDKEIPMEEIAAWTNIRIP